MRRFVISAVVLLILVTSPALLIAETSKSLTVIGSSAPEIQLHGKIRFQKPFLTGDGPLSEGNNIKLDITGKLSPVSTNLVLNGILTPIAFLEFSAGGQIGTGWTTPLPGLGDLPGITLSSNPGTVEPAADPLGGAVYHLRAGGAFQFDLAAIFPGEWNHVLIRAYQEINYREYTGAEEGELWDYEISGGLVNGYSWFASYVLAYQVPLFGGRFSTFGLMGETEMIDITETTNIFGDLYFTGSILANLAITDTFSITLIPQITNKYSHEDFDTPSVGDLRFKRFAFQFTWAL